MLKRFVKRLLSCLLLAALFAINRRTAPKAPPAE